MLVNIVLLSCFCVLMNNTGGFMCGSTQAQKHGAKIKFINWLFVMSVREILLEAIT